MSRPVPDPGADDPSDATFGVGELSAAINGVLRSGFPGGVWVRGEISGWSARGPHAYFQLVEDTDTGRATLSVSFFAPMRSRLRPVLESSGLRLADGLQVRVHGSLDLYAPSGRLGLKMDGIDPNHTLGDLALQRDALLRRLAASGLLDANRAVPLSPAPLRLGVVTSAASAAWADFRHELERSGLGFHVRLADVRVQGDQAVGEISEAIALLGSRSDVDVVVVIRGGGARTDLAAFDAEEIALAICRSPLPVFTGLGHETDRSIADEVAHRALKTPTACATCLVEIVTDHIGRCEDAWAGIRSVAETRLTAARTALGVLGQGISHRTLAAVTRAADRLDHRTERAASAVRRRLDDADDGLTAAAEQLARRAPRIVVAADQRIDSIAAQVRLLDPVHVLARGWSITRDHTGAVVRDPASLVRGEILTTEVAAGTITSTVTASSTGTTAATTDPSTVSPRTDRSADPNHPGASHD